MTVELDDLARQIADTGKWVPRPGQAVRSPAGRVWRCLAPHVWASAGTGSVHDGLDRLSSTPSRTQRDLLEAIACGPDLDDEVTALSLLAELPHASLLGNFGRRDGHLQQDAATAGQGSCTAEQVGQQVKDAKMKEEIEKMVLMLRDETGRFPDAEVRAAAADLLERIDAEKRALAVGLAALDRARKSWHD